MGGVVFLAERRQKPGLVEGPAGTGKTQLAKSVADMPGSRLIRLQCYEGLDESKALYEWNYKKQLLRIQAQRVAEEDGTAASWHDIEEDIFSEECLRTRPLLEASRASEPVVLLIDEVDRVEVETEALLLEILSDYQVSIPELGTVMATQVPLVFLTSNNTRELSEALKRRCLYLHLDYPDLPRETEIVLARVPGIPETLADQIARDVRHIPMEDREAFKYALAATLVKNHTHWKAFETVFEVYFSLRRPGPGEEGDLDGDVDAGNLQLDESGAAGGGSMDSLSPEELAEMLCTEL